MARFDVHSHRGEGYLLDCQANVLSHFGTRFVVPLLPLRDAPSASRLHPHFHIEGEAHIMLTQLASAVALRELGPKVASLADEDIAITSALDMLLTGC